MTLVKRASDIAVLGLFMLAIYLPFAGYALKLDAAGTVDENRKLHALPPLPSSLAEARSWPRAVDGFWTDRFGFRPRLIKWNALLKVAEGTSPTDLVIVGKHGRLFYASGGELIMPSFQGKAPFSTAQLEALRVQLEARRDWLAARGAKYLFIVAPNKESIYPEDLEDKVPRGDPHRLDQLIAYLQQHSTFQILDVRPALMKLKGKEQLFHNTDTHWTDIGEFAGYEPIRDQLKAWFPNFKGRTADDFERVNAPPFSGDLSSMMALVGTLTDDRIELKPKGGFGAHQLTDNAYRHGGTRIAQWTGRPDGPRLVLFHDSFFLSPEHRDAPPEPHESTFEMVPLLAEEFSYTYSQWRHEFAPDIIEREHPDVVIQEMVERALINGMPGSVPPPVVPKAP